MTDRPILFSAPMVRALLAGKKTQTRRVVKSVELARGGARGVRVAPSTFCYLDFDGVPGLSWRPFGGCPTVPYPPEKVAAASPYGAPGDRLWVRETWALVDDRSKPATTRSGVLYRATDRRERSFSGSEKWRPSIHMPRWASRITLEVTGVRVERLQDISEEDAKAEGAAHRIAPGGDLSAVFDALPGEKAVPIGYRAHFRDLWESINGADSWASNPWVWVVSFRRVTP